MSKELKAGIFAIVVLVAFIWSYNFLKGKNIFSPNMVFYAVYENVQGIQAGRPITINGVKVGSIGQIDFDKGDLNKIVIKMEIKKGTSFPEDSRAVIRSGGFLGDKDLQIDLGKSSVAARSGDTLVSSIDAGLLENLTEGIDPIKSLIVQNLVNLEKSLEGLNHFFNASNIGNIDSILLNVRKISSHAVSITSQVEGIVSENRTTLNGMFTSLSSTSENLDRITEKLSQAELDRLVADLDTTVNNLNRLLLEARTGEGTIGQLIGDSALYDELNSSVQALNLLLTDVRENPRRYLNFSVFGSRDRAPKAEKASK